MKKRSRFLQVPIEPFTVDPEAEGRRSSSKRWSAFRSRGAPSASAHRVWQKMLEDDVTIFMGMAGALSAGGLRMVVAHLIEHRFIDCLVSTGANLYHDLHETRGQHHYVGSARANDAALADDRIDRVYDTYASEEEFCDNDVWIGDFVATLDQRPYTSREFLNRLGGHLWKQDAAGRHSDGGVSRGRADLLPRHRRLLDRHGPLAGAPQAAGIGHIDVIGDIIESANLVIRRPRTATIVLGGGTPKNFINQASVQAEFFSPAVGGHRYALQIVTDVPHFGGASGSTLEEAQSWGKLATDAAQVTVHADATIALPLLATALARSSPRSPPSASAQYSIPASPRCDRRQIGVA